MKGVVCGFVIVVLVDSDDCRRVSSCVEKETPIKVSVQ